MIGYQEREKEGKKEAPGLILRHLFLSGLIEVTYLLAVTVTNKGVL